MQTFRYKVEEIHFFAVKYIHKHALPKTEMRFFTVCFCPYDKGVLIFMAMVVNISIMQQQWCLKPHFFFVKLKQTKFALKTPFSHFSVFKLH